MAAGDLITADGQLEYNGYVLGDDVTTFMVSLTGWEDLPPIDSSNTLKPASYGAWAGKKLPGQRILTWNGRFAPEETSNWADALSSLKRAFTIPTADEELTIVVRTRDDVKIVYGAVTQRAIPMDYSYSYFGANVTIQFECSDPRKYSLSENTRFISMPSDTEDGLDYPLVYPLDYGVDTIISDLIVENEGDAPSPVILTFTGPVTNPTLLNSTTGYQIGFNIDIADGEFLEVNTRTGTVLLNGTADRLYTRQVTSSPILGFTLLPGNNEMHVYADEWTTGAGVEIVYRDAYL
jgi:hypothetical protein